MISKNWLKDNLESVGINPGRIMDIKEAVGQILMFSFKGKRTIPSYMKKWKIGGAILFKENIEDRKQLKDLCKKLQNIAHLPLFVGIDQEGTRVNRIGREIFDTPSLTEEVDRDELYKRARYIGEELKRLGINLNFAPVLDVLREYSSPVMKGRCISDDPYKVGIGGSAIIRGFTSAGIFCCAKHFPGHGGCKRDSHKCLPHVYVRRREWEKKDLYPFVKAIENKVPFIMVGHLVYKFLEPELPTSVSPKVIEYLRERLDFKGIIVTDDISMDAIRRHFDLSEFAIKAFNAGVDIILYCGDSYAEKYTIFTKLVMAVKKGIIKEKRLEEVVGKILKLKVLLAKDIFRSKN